ncbi:MULTISPECIES: glutathione synthase [unclassified Tepidimonas]|uniref:glutathione synthase n=1 Tax=unclassified Tepidimonas TaxID=2631705 RepID=UPI003C7C6801
MTEAPAKPSLRRVLVVADPLHTFVTYKDSTYAMMRELARRGVALAACEPAHLHWRSGEPVTAWVREVTLTDDPHAWFAVRRQGREPLHAFDAVLMRKDPPFDAEYFYATHLLQQAEREGARVFNRPAALRDHPEKLAVMEFAPWAPSTLVTRSAEAIRAFHAEHRDIILKPLDGMGGRGIFRVGPDGMNLGVVVETLTAHGHTTIMVQRYLPQIAHGDKRILLIGGEPVPYCLARIPQAGEVRGNLAAGGRGEARPLSDADWAIARAVGPTLAARGLLLVGLDVIGEWITEINVTSPTCFQEITQQTGYDVAGRFVDALQDAVGAAARA